MDLDFSNIFNATIGVYWAVFFIPRMLKEKKYKLLGLVNAVMLVIQIVLFMHHATRDFPFNFLAGVASFCLGNFIGYCMYVYETKIQKDQS
jgi:Ca2+/Na+ antiporter